MPNLFVVGFAGPDLSKRLLDFVLERARLASATVHLVHVIEWSPFTFETASALAERHLVREKQKEQAEAMLERALAALHTKGVPLSTEVRFGHVADALCDVVEARHGCQIFVGRSGASPMAARIIGSVALSLVQAAPVPVTVVP